MIENYETIEGYKGSEYEEAILLYERAIDFEIWDIQIENECDQLELEYYQKVIESKQFKPVDNEYQDLKFLMLIPIKYKIPFFKPWISFDFETVVLDISHYILFINLINNKTYAQT